MLLLLEVEVEVVVEHDGEVDEGEVDEAELLLGHVLAPEGKIIAISVQVIQKKGKVNFGQRLPKEVKNKAEWLPSRCQKIKINHQKG